jgi:choline dehydrogenase-like flavoprotein
MAGTVKMGKSSEPESCVDHDLRVLGVKSLRVADMSILPIQPKYVSLSSLIS